MTFKINLSEKGKTYKVESENPSLIGKKIGDTVLGKEIDSKFEGYEFKITGASSKEGFPAIAGVEGVGLKKSLLKKGKGMKTKKPKGLKLRKTVHSHNINQNITQINLVVKKQGTKPLAEVFGKKEEKAKEDKKMEEEEKTEEKEEEKEETKEEETTEEPAEEKAEEPAEETSEEPAEEKAEEEKKEE
jgi:ribosomal protein S6E (S10)